MPFDADPSSPLPPFPVEQRKRDDDAPPEVIALQPVAIIDHSCKVDDHLLRAVGGEVGGSTRVDSDQLQRLLMSVGEFTTKAGGSAANTARGLSRGFDVRVGLIGAVGRDEWGSLFVESMSRSGVRVDGLTVKGEKSFTGRCACLVGKDGQRTMRPSLQDAVRLQPDEIDPARFVGVKWVIVNGYSYYGAGLVEASVDAAVAAGCKVAMHLASFEIVRTFRAPIERLLAGGKIAAVFANEDEARELAGGDRGAEVDVAAALSTLAEKCEVAVVTLGDEGCVARRGDETVAQRAFRGFPVEDTTGAGDLFSSGFMYGLLRDLPLRRCCEIGCLAGAAVVQVMGAEVSPEGWTWFHAHLHEGRAANLARGGTAAVQRELLRCHELIHSIGRGVVYYGSARLGPESPHHASARALGKAVAELLGSPTWTGGGPGMMEAVMLGAMDADTPVGGVRVAREAGTTAKAAAKSRLPPECAAHCEFLSTRKVALVDAATRKRAEDRTAHVFLPGGLGTMDELFELLASYRLKSAGADHPAPVVVVSYDGFYDGLLALAETMKGRGAIGAGEYGQMVIKRTNEEVVEYLREYYDL